jgi:hypothetical protein
MGAECSGCGALHGAATREWPVLDSLLARVSGSGLCVCNYGTGHKEYGEIIFFFSARETCQASTATELHLQPSPKHFILAVLEFELSFVLA